MKNWWWKIGAALMILYVLVAGLCVPAKPTVVAVTPETARTGETVTLNLEGYNTFFTQLEQPRAWLRVRGQEHAIKAKKIEARDDRHLVCTFQIPQFLPTDEPIVALSVFVDDPKFGTTFSIRRLMVSQDSVNVENGKTAFNERLTNLNSPKNALRFPLQPINLETNRNLFFHVPMWFAMLVLLGMSVFYSIKYLRSLNQNNATDIVEKQLFDLKANAFAQTGTLFGTVGFVTGMLWANYTWGSPLSMDIKIISAGISVLIYYAYFIFRNSFEDTERAARFSAVYNIFAFVSLPTLIFVLPRLTDSLHPGSGGNPALSTEDSDNTLKLVFYPACIAWILIGFWISQLVFRYKILKEKFLAKNNFEF